MIIKYGPAISLFMGANAVQAFVLLVLFNEVQKCGPWNHLCF